MFEERPVQRHQPAHGVVEPVERIHHGPLGLQHERQDGAEFLVKREAESAVLVEALVARLEDLPAFCFGVVALDPLGGVDHGASGSAAAGVGVHPHDGRVVGFLDLGHRLEQRVDVGRRDAVDLDEGRWDRPELERRVHDDAEQPDAAHDGVEELVRPVDLERLAVGEQEREADDLVGEAAVAPGVLAVDVGTDRAGDAGVRFGRAGGEREQAVVDRLVDVDESRAGLDGDLRALLVELEDPVHAAHVEQGVAVVERQVPVAAAGARARRRSCRAAGSRPAPRGTARSSSGGRRGSAFGWSRPARSALSTP